MSVNPEDSPFTFVSNMHHMPHHILKPPSNAMPFSVQEWSGQSWEIVEVLGEPSMAQPTPLDALSFPGQYLGQRVVTA